MRLCCWVFPVLLGLAACTTSSSPPTLDASVRAGDAGSATTFDGGRTGHPDASLETPDAAGAADAAAVIARAVGQCRSQADCPGISTCNALAPGGICNGCGGDQDCPGAFNCGGAGACSLDCATDVECPAGWRCGNGTCRILACVSGVCPDEGLGCNAFGLCARRNCSEGCPQRTTCMGAVCVEDR